MADFGIFAPKLGVRSDMPSVLMDASFAMDDSRDVHEIYGEYRKLKGRLVTMTDADGVAIRAPKLVYAISAVDMSAKTFTMTGLYATAINAAMEDDQIRIMASTGNDGLYTVTNVAEGGATTVLSVSEDIDDATADGNVFVGLTPVLYYYTHTKESTDTDYQLLFTAYHILLWNETAMTLAVKFACGTPTSVTAWSVVSHADKVYATNNVDLIQVWDVHTSVSSDFADCDTASGLDLGDGSYCTAAKYLDSFEGYLFAGYVTIDGTIEPRKTLWDDASGTDTFDSGDAGQKTLGNSPGFIVGFGHYLDNLIVAKTDAISLGYLTTDDTVFSWPESHIKIGCLSGRSIINDPSGNLYYFAKDYTIRNLASGDSVIRHVEKVLKNINPGYSDLICSIYVSELDSIFWAVPYGTSATNSLWIQYNVASGKVSLHSREAYAFGKFVRSESPTYTSIGRLYSTYEEWGLAWETYLSGISQGGALTFLCSDGEGYTYEMAKSTTDARTTYSGDLILNTTLTKKPDLLNYKRIPDRVVVWCNRRLNSDLSLYVRTDTANAWTLVGTQSMADDDEPEIVAVAFPCSHLDIRGRSFQWKITSESYFEIVGMIVENFTFDGVA